MIQDTFAYVKDHQAEMRKMAYQEAYCRYHRLQQRAQPGLVSKAFLLLANRLIDLGNWMQNRLQSPVETIPQNPLFNIYPK